MERVQFRTVNDSRLASYEHFLAIFEVVDDHGSGVTQSDLEDRVFVLTPPFLCWISNEGLAGNAECSAHLADSSMVLPELEKMSDNGICIRDFEDAFDLWNVSLGRELDLYVSKFGQHTLRSREIPYR